MNITKSAMLRKIKINTMKLPKQVKMILFDNNAYLIANNHENLIVTFSAKMDEQENAEITAKDGRVVLISSGSLLMEKIVIDMTKVIGYQP
jgi:hypothetical protein